MPLAPLSRSISWRVFMLLFFGAAPTLADTWQVGPGEAFSTIQAAIDTAAPGDTVEVAPGLYPEQLVISKSPLTLAGARTGVDARGRVIGAPDPASESILSPATGPALRLESSPGPITISGFSILSPAPTGSAAIIAATTPLDTCSIRENVITVSTASDGSALALPAGATDITIERNVFLAAPGSPACIDLTGGATFHGLHLVENDLLRDGPAAHHGLVVDGPRNLGPSTLRAPLIRGNRFEGHGTGLGDGGQSITNAEIRENTFRGNLRGLLAGPADSLVASNLWIDNDICGLQLAGSGSPAAGARGCTIEGNTFQNNGATTDPGGYGDLVTGPQPAGSHETNKFQQNRLTSTAGLFQADAGATVDASLNYWGAADGPSGHATGSGAALLGPGATLHEPFYADPDLTNLVFGATPLTGSLALGSGESITGDELTLAPSSSLEIGDAASVDTGAFTMQAGSVVNVHGGSLRCGSIDLAPGAILDVVDGQLSLDPLGTGEFHTIAGSFTFFNCLGSININGNTSFAGETLGLVSNIHVAPGVTLHVLGSLDLDGCRIDGPPGFTILVDEGAHLSMTRCEVSGASQLLVGSEVLLRDNRFDSGSIIALASVDGAEIYHNVFHDGLGTLVVLPGAVTITNAEGWSNVTSPDLVQNRLSLDWEAPVDPTRTLDTDGQLYIQPGDPLACSLGIGNLNTTAQAVEALLGFDTDYLAPPSLAPSAEWDNGLYHSTGATGFIGCVDSTIGLAFSHPNPDGTTEDGTVAQFTSTAATREGRTRMFFRPHRSSDPDYIDTRITTSTAGVPSYRHLPFTRNSNDLIVDGTPPEFANQTGASQTQGGGPVDVLVPGTLTREGVLTAHYAARDTLAGIDPEDATIALTATGITVPGTPTGTTVITEDGDEFTSYAFEITIDSSVPDDIYSLSAEVMDRSGNLATLDLGTIEVVKRRIFADITTEGLVTTPLTREVEFIATDSGGSQLATWATPVDFTNSLGSVTLGEVPAATAFLSAKTAWNLRIRLPLSFDSSGDATASFTADNTLPGGDFTGDNIINTFDYIIFRGEFPSIADRSDITGDGRVNTPDYIIFRNNWLTAGDLP